MINGKMWLVVKPTVGIPLMLGGVVVSALSVHTAILLNTTWFPAFLQGKPRAAASLSDSTAPAVALMKPGTPNEYAALLVK
ncbi:light-harvesting protein [Roseococcus sp. SDR]|uniref:light-harvesting protein n=1 Tax=Roseococcus sp. SDR TaxID=2835532 RepID=UPI001BCE3F40|nr:light-harvesting protein [Roseococcus sp. SDR]MBS7789131.1 light-harvesting protein [Roseococcus sp. SDR]MBV1844445.1 light-harvesting protein [Roseococcus sp. SDR]